MKSDVTCGQVWWPILGICALHFTHPKCTHTAVNTHTPWTHTRSSGQPFMLRLPGEQMVVRCLAQGSHLSRGIEGGALTFTLPTYNSCRTWDSNSQPLGLRDWLSNHDCPLTHTCSCTHIFRLSSLVVCQCVCVRETAWEYVSCCTCLITFVLQDTDLLWQDSTRSLWTIPSFPWTHIWLSFQT